MFGKELRPVMDTTVQLSANALKDMGQWANVEARPWTPTQNPFVPLDVVRYNPKLCMQCTGGCPRC